MFFICMFIYLYLGQMCNEFLITACCGSPSVCAGIICERVHKRIEGAGGWSSRRRRRPTKKKRQGDSVWRRRSYLINTCPSGYVCRHISTQENIRVYPITAHCCLFAPSRFFLSCRSYIRRLVLVLLPEGILG